MEQQEHDESIHGGVRDVRIVRSRATEVTKNTSNPWLWEKKMPSLSEKLGT